MCYHLLPSTLEKEHTPLSDSTTYFCDQYIIFAVIDMSGFLDLESELSESYTGQLSYAQ